MPEIPPRLRLALLVLVVAAVAAVGHRASTGSGEAPPPAAAAPITVREAPRAADAERVTVHVAGAVERPGLYRLPPGARIDDAIRRAGGPARRADLAALNLAAEAQDGRQVLVPERPARGRGAGTVAATGPAPAGGATAAAGASGVGAAAAPVDLNTATLEQLDTLDGVGPATAQKILEHREASGGFSSIDELDQIPGIGEKRLASLREQVTL